MTIMVIVTGVYWIIPFPNHSKCKRGGRSNLLQRMTALIVNQLEEEGANAKEVLSAYEKDMSVSSKLTDAYGELLYESRTGLEDIEGQLNNVGMQIVTYSAEEEGNQAKLPAVEGMVEMKGNHYERYLINLAHFTSEDDTNNSLTLVYEQTPIFQMFLVTAADVSGNLDCHTALCQSGQPLFAEESLGANRACDAEPERVCCFCLP